MKKIAAISTLLLFACLTCLGQTSSKGLTPGRGAGADADRVLGRPVKEVSKTLVEHKSPGESGRLFVRYGDEPVCPRSQADRVVYCHRSGRLKKTRLSGDGFEQVLQGGQV